MLIVDPRSNAHIRKADLEAAIAALREYQKVAPDLPRAGSTDDPFLVFQEYGFELEELDTPEDDYELHCFRSTYLSSWPALFFCIGHLMRGTFRYVDNGSHEGWNFRYGRAPTPLLGEVVWKNDVMVRRFIDPKYVDRLLDRIVRTQAIVRFRSTVIRVDNGPQHTTTLPHTAATEFFYWLLKHGGDQTYLVSVEELAFDNVHISMDRAPRRSWDAKIVGGTIVELELSAPYYSFVKCAPRSYAEPLQAVPDGAVGLPNPEGAEDLGTREGGATEE